MLFWLFVIILIVGIALCIVGNKLYEYRYSDNKRKDGFFYKHSLDIETAGVWTAGISAVVVTIMIIVLCCMHINVDANVEENKERYLALEYKVTSGACRDELGLLSKEVIDEVQDWNEDVKYYQTAQNDFWIGIFIPNVFDQFETIDYGRYNTGE